MKRFIQICSLLSLLVLFTVVSANAQNGFGSDVEIPFAFSVGDKSYDAGNYIVRLERISAGTSALTIQDTKTDELQTVLLNVNSSGVAGDMKLVFDTVEGKKYLTKVRTSDKTYGLIQKKVDSKGAKVKSSAGAVIGGGADLF